jgi:hypothetical protein
MDASNTRVCISAEGRIQCRAVEPRRTFVFMAVLAVICAGAQALLGEPELALYLTPLFLIGGMLLAGRYVGEERLVARLRAARSRPGRRRAGRRWARAVDAVALTSLLARSPRTLRGPPARLRPAA